MAERNQKVYDRVRQELASNPDLGSRDLYEIAQTVEKSIGQDSLQQFHARYFLPAKREQRQQGTAAPPKRPARSRQPRKQAQKESPAATPASPSPGRETGGEGPNRDRIRAVLLQFAQDITDADSRSGLVQVLARVDSYVDRIASGKR